MKLQISGLQNDSIVDGVGIRFTIFTQGCPHHCPGCHNPQTHSISGGALTDTEEIIRLFLANPLLDGITLSGGEPFLQAPACLELARAAHGAGLSVWTYTGYTLEELLASRDSSVEALLAETDVLIDGRFEQNHRSLDLPFCGSKNQRLIAVAPSLANGRAVLWKPEGDAAYA